MVIPVQLRASLCKTNREGDQSEGLQLFSYTNQNTENRSHKGLQLSRSLKTLETFSCDNPLFLEVWSELFSPKFHVGP